MTYMLVELDDAVVRMLVVYVCMQESMRRSSCFGVLASLMAGFICVFGIFANSSVIFLSQLHIILCVCGIIDTLENYKNV